MTTSTRRQSSVLGIPPLPSSQKAMVAVPISQSQPREQHGTVEAQQRGAVLSLERGSLELTPAHDETDLGRIDSNRAAGHARAIPLKRRRSLPCPQSVPSGNHFLQGIALDDCKDILSIPDPPSPPPPEATLSKQRRASAIFVPLRDLSNGEQGSPMNKRNALSTCSSRKPKRSRLSLPNMASPLVSKKTTASKSCAVDDPPSPTETARASVPPAATKTAPDPQHQQSNQPTEKDEKASFQTFKSPEKAPDVYEIPTQPDAEKLMEIRKLVHSYTLLPKEERFESRQAKKIEAISGYPVVSAFIPPSAVSETDKHERRKKIIANLNARMQNVDGCKVRDAKLTQSVTQCRVHKLRGGYVEYSYIPTGRPVPPEEFEARYLCMVDEVSSMRSKSWGDYFAKLSQDIKQKTAEKSTDDSNPLSESSSHWGTSSNPSQEHDPAPTSKSEECRPIEPSDEAETATDSNSQDHAVEMEDEDFCSEAIYKTIDTTQPQHSEEQTRITPAKNLPRPPSPRSPDMLLPFPSRDEPSTNALIARAEHKLWTAIDDALATYSKEVLDIEAAAASKTM